MNLDRLAAAVTAIVGLALAFGIDLPKDEIAGMITVLVETVVAVAAIIIASLTHVESPPPPRPPPPH